MIPYIIHRLCTIRWLGTFWYILVHPRYSWNGIAFQTPCLHITSPSNGIKQNNSQHIRYGQFRMALSSASVVTVTMEEQSTSSSLQHNLRTIFDLCDQDRDGVIAVRDFERIGRDHLENAQVSYLSHEGATIG